MQNSPVSRQAGYNVLRISIDILGSFRQHEKSDFQYQPGQDGPRLRPKWHRGVVTERKTKVLRKYEV